MFAFRNLPDLSKKLLLSGGVLFILLLLGEGLFRGLGYVPGRHAYNEWYSEVDQIELLSGYVTGKDGIQKVDTAVFKLLEKDITWMIRSGRQIFRKNESRIAREILTLRTDYADLNVGNVSNHFSRFIAGLKVSPPSILSNCEKAILDYCHQPINREGFRSIAFDPSFSDRPKVLLLGDSFTWGHSSQNKTSSFADVLLAMGYAVFNTGISGVDPAQYLQVARVYAPVLKPDYIVVNFFLGNDVQNWKRVPKAFSPVYYATNAGNLFNCPHGSCFDDPETLYEFIAAQAYIPRSGRWFDGLCSKTVLTSLLWGVLADYKLVDRFTDPDLSEYYHNMSRNYREVEYANEQLKAIQGVAAAVGAEFRLIMIPEYRNGKFSHPSDFPGLAADLPYFWPEGIGIQDFDQENHHFNDEGHLKYALFVEDCIQGWARPFEH